MHWFTPHQAMPLRPSVPRWTWLALGAWLLAVGGGWAALTHYASRPGASSAAPPVLAESAEASLRNQLILFVHPRCPCSAATVRELGRVLARCTAPLDTTVYFYRPESESDDWVIGRLWNSAAKIPGVRTAVDPGGRMARRYGSWTSGDALLYDASGRLRFHGGITPARGHEGDSLGKSAILASLRGEAIDRPAGPVYGCSLQAEGSIP